MGARRRAWGAEARKHIAALLKQAERKGAQHVDIRAGEVEKRLWPHGPTRTPCVCGAMIALMAPGDWFRRRPPNGLGTRLTIRYRLPRPCSESGMRHSNGSGV